MSKSDPYDLVGAFSCRCIRSGFDPLTWLHSKLFASSDVLVSVDHLSPAASPLAGTKAPIVLNVRCGDFVIVCESSARDPNANSLFQLAGVDSRVIRWVNADQLTHSVRSLDGLPFACCLCRANVRRTVFLTSVSKY